MKFKKWATLAVVTAFFTFAGSALAAGPREGSGGNNVVCGGVPTHALLMYYANGGVDSCGHRDIKTIWAAMGITPQVVRMMVSGTACSSTGFTSSGRRHSPNPSLDRPRTAGGSLVYFRPLLVWGPGCYSAWVGRTEDGRIVAVLKGCGNGETTHVPPKPAPTPTPSPTKAPITVYKIALDEHGSVLPATPTNTFHFQVTTYGNNKSAWYNATPQSLGSCTVGKTVTVRELTPRGPETWQMLSPNPQVFTCKKGGVRAVFKDQELGVVVPTAPVTISKSCIDAVDHQLVGGCPTNTFTFVVTPDGGSASKVTYNPAPGTTDVPAGMCVIGKNVTAVEQPVTGWTAAPGTSGTQTLPCTASGARFVFKNMETTSPPTPSANVPVLQSKSLWDPSGTSNITAANAGKQILLHATVFGSSGNAIESFNTTLRVGDSNSTLQTPDGSPLTLTPGQYVQACEDQAWLASLGEVAYNNGVAGNLCLTAQAVAGQPATLNFTNRTVATPATTPTGGKDGTTGPGAGTPGAPGGPGAGGTPGTGTGGLCRDPVTQNLRPGQSDQFGYCV